MMFHVMVKSKEGVSVTTRLCGYRTYAKAKEVALKNTTADVVRGNRYLLIVQQGKVCYERGLAA